MKKLASIVLIALLGACGGTSQRVLLDQSVSDLRTRPSVRTLEVKQISLPAYAEEQAIFVQGDDGALVELNKVLWADLPSRALTGAMVRHLSVITGARVAAEPWPLAGFAQAELVVRVENIAVQADGTLQLSGQYAVNYDSAGRAGKLRLFDLRVPVDGSGSAAVAAAYDAAWRQLAEAIAGNV